MTRSKSESLWVRLQRQPGTRTRQLSVGFSMIIPTKNEQKLKSLHSLEVFIGDSISTLPVKCTQIHPTFTRSSFFLSFICLFISFYFIHLIIFIVFFSFFLSFFLSLSIFPCVSICLSFLLLLSLS